MADIAQLKQATDVQVEEINKLLEQFNDRKTSLALLDTLVQSPDAELWVVTEGTVIVGMATLVLVHKLAGVSTRIEDVVVDETQRGKGLGKALCQKLIDRSRELGAYSIHLTSRPDREAANALYQKLGFQKHDTNAYRLSL